MYTMAKTIPVSLHSVLSKKLIDIVLSNDTKNIPVELVKEIIYMWRQDQLASETGINVLLEASVYTSVNDTNDVLNELGLMI